MTGLNHTLTGIIIAVTIKDPVVAPAAALLSHFILDAVPHFDHPKLEAGQKVFNYYLIFEAVSMTTATIIAMLLFPSLWLLVFACAFLAFSPDILWYFEYFRPKASITERLGRYLTFAKAIQWYERPRGLIVEILYLLFAMGLIGYLSTAK